MGDTGSENRPARLPGNAPEALRSFVACTTDRVELDLADMGWVPKPSGIPDAATPEVGVEDGWTPSSATIRVGWGFVSIGLPATIINGQLHIDSTGLGFGIGDEIDPWVDAFNETLRANGKQLDTFDVTDGKVTMTKRAIPAAADGDAAAVAAGASVVVGAEATESEEPPKKKSGCLAWVIGAIVAVAAGVGLFLATNGGSDNDSVSKESGQPASSSSTTSSSSTSTTSSTIAQVGQAPEPDSDVLAICGTPNQELLDHLDDGDLDGYMLIGGDCQIDGAYLPRNFDDVDVPDPGPTPRFVASGTRLGWTHQPSQPDFFTGEEGPSFALANIYYQTWGSDALGVAYMSSDCGGVIHSGADAIQPDGTGQPEHPLFSFGECQVVDLGVIVENESGEQHPIPIPPGSLENGGLFTVGPNEHPAAPLVLEPYPQIVGPDAVGPEWSDAVQEVANVLGGTDTLGPHCNAMFEPQAIPGGADHLLFDPSMGCGDQFWVFAAAQQSVEFDLEVEDTVTGHMAIFVNPLGEVRPAIASTIDFDSVLALFDGRDGTPDTAIFPCGFGHVALTLCPDTAPPMDTGAFVSVGVATGGPIPIEWDGTPRSYTVEFDQAAATALLDEAGWSIESTDGERVRGLIRDNSITFVFPQDEVDPGSDLQEELSYKLISTIGENTTEQPSVPVVGLITSPIGQAVIEPGETDTEDETAAPPEATPAPIETLDDFYSNLTASLSSGDAGFSLDRLAPTVFEAYPTQCPAAMERFADPELVIVPIEEGDTAPWTWELPDGRTFDIPNATEVTVVLTGRGQAGTESEAHLELINGQYHWFTLCE